MAGSRSTQHGQLATGQLMAGQELQHYQRKGGRESLNKGCKRKCEWQKVK